MTAPGDPSPAVEPELTSAELKELLQNKRDGRTLTPAQCARFLKGVARGTVPEPEQVALLASIWFQGMAPAELQAWTRGMVASGERLDLSGFDGPKVDKHSTGGIGDKVSLPLAPALAALGCIVPMISGRGLGHTGGTLDKLEAVPGFRTGLSEDEIYGVLREAGAVICAQTTSIAPADRVLYAMRDRVELVESLPLIASSIVSKKVAEDIDALVLDVKTGSGAFLTDIERGRELGATMVALAAASGLEASARITDMSRPLGRAVGHALEIEETFQTLHGEGPADLVELVVTFAADLAVGVKRFGSREEARSEVEAVLQDGRGLASFERMLRAQGAGATDLRRSLPKAPDVEAYRCESAGCLAFGDLREVGLAVRDLGGGRSAPGDVIDPAVGLVFQAVAGETVQAGQEIVLIHHRGGHGLEAARARLARAIRLQEGASPGPPPLLHERIAGPSR